MTGLDHRRLPALDLVRGVAVLGILAVNIAGFAAPESAAFSPNLPRPGSPADNWAFAFTLVFFEGKMRALFSILFGASLMLFIQRREESGRDGASLQQRRLFWLALIGWLHFVLFWDGDILFVYAAVGFAAVAMWRTPPAPLWLMAIALFSAWQIWGVANWTPSAALEAQVISGEASPAQQQTYAEQIKVLRADDAADLRGTLSPWPQEIAARQAQDPVAPLGMLAYNWGETLSYVMIGMALLQGGFFAGTWSRRRYAVLALGGTGLGLAATLAFTVWAFPRGFPEFAMHLATGYLLAFPHLLIALGYAAALILAAPRLLETRLGQRFAAAGRMAFSNYLGTTVLMCALFNGWGLGLFGQYGPAQRWLFVLGAWAIMLIWSPLWLKTFRQGPLEWLWRSLGEWRKMPLLRRS